MLASAMPVNLPVGMLYAFLLVLARVGGAFTFVPLPGSKARPNRCGWHWRWDSRFLYLRAGPW